MSPVAFTTAYCVAYIVALATDAAVIRHYPQAGRWVWGWQQLEQSGPAITWYGLMASAAIAALLAATVSGALPTPGGWRRYAWVPPLAAMVSCLYLMRRFFF